MSSRVGVVSAFFGHASITEAYSTDRLLCFPTKRNAFRIKVSLLLRVKK